MTHFCRIAIAAALPIICSATQVFSAVGFTPGTKMYDTDGKVIDAHAFDIQKFGGTWYWYGNAPRIPGGEFGFYSGINCYSSTDLKNWHFEGKVQTPSGTACLGTTSISYDPHVIYNSSTSKYVMVFSLCVGSAPSTWNNHFCFAASSTPNGTFTLQTSGNGADGRNPMDMMAFKDDDGSAYVIYSANNNGIAIDKLSNDYLSVASNVAYFGGGTCHEAPCMFKANGIYYLYNSYCAGWGASQGHYWTATSLSGPWSASRNLGDGNTYNSQGTTILTIMGAVDTTYVYVADRWNCTSPDNYCNFYANCTYVFLPLLVNGSTLTLDNYSTWYLNVPAGTWSLVDDSTTVAMPVFSPRAGRYAGAQSVTIACATSGATIRYTTNGADPTSASPAYVNPIPVTQTTTIKARGFKGGMTDSDIATAVYQIVAPGTNWTIFTDQTPANPNVTEAQGLELGVKFTSNAAGRISAIRYYRSAGETGAHTGRIWSASGTQLASATFSGETSSRWQEALLAGSLAISAGVVYVVSVNYNTAYVASNSGLTSAVVNGPLSTVADGANGTYGAAGAFPTQTYQNSNYFRDVVFSESTTAAAPRPRGEGAVHPSFAAGFTGGVLRIAVSCAGSHTVNIMDISGALVRSFSATGPRTYELYPTATSRGMYIIDAIIDGSRVNRRLIVR